MYLKKKKKKEKQLPEQDKFMALNIETKFDVVNIQKL